MTDASPNRKSTLLALAGFVVLWLLLDRTAAALGSYRGDAGAAVCIIVLAAAFAVEFLLSRRPPLRVLSDLGLRAPDAHALIWTLVLCAVLLAYYPAFAAATGTELGLHPDWAVLATGMLLQAGVAEETVFRGFLFRRLREGRGFWGAAGLAAIPFTAVHLLLFLTLDWPLALASTLLAVAVSFPLAWLFERGGGSIWLPALVHAVIQGSIKLIEAGDSFQVLAFGWMALTATAPWAVFLIRSRGPRGRG